MTRPRDVHRTPLSISGCLVDADTEAVLAAVDADRVRPTASIGKVLLLIEVARRLSDGRLSPSTPLSRTPADQVADSGLWQHLRVSSLSAPDLAALVGAVSDNLATNVLLRTVGLPAIAAVAQELDLVATGLHDQVRDDRAPEHPPTLSTGTAAELATLMGRLHRGAPPLSDIAPVVLGWLHLDTDTSMVAAAFGLDPLAHAAFDRGLWLAHKTGTDTGIRAEVGLLRGSHRTVAYAVLAEFEDADRDEALAQLRDWGSRIRGLCG